MTIYLVQVETDGDVPQALLPVERVNSDDYDLGTPPEIAEITAANQNLTEVGRVVVTDVDGRQLTVHRFDFTPTPVWGPGAY